ncbi:eCIS core domain-containing protein [Streptomyces triculaminicus]|uniref:eCIS core domain-containing protein n=1 Tax=Streptomyces triculaminicus TaxID=2816232 RepID=UPI0037CD2CBA
MSGPAKRTTNRPGNTAAPHTSLGTRRNRLAPERGASLTQDRRRPGARTHPRIVDADSTRADRTAHLLARLAGQLGFRISEAKIVVDEEAARRTAPRGARGLLADGVIWLHPDRYDPATAAGRALLAHEAAHLAQRGARRHLAPVATLTDAEAEAARAATDFAEGRELTAVSAALPDGAAAADTGAQVLDTYAREITVIRAQLRGGWLTGIDDADVSYVLLVLDQYQFATATAIARAVGTPYLARLPQHLNEGHRRRHQQSVTAWYGAMTADDKHRLDRRLFDGMNLDQAPPAERATIVEVLRELPGSTFAELLQGPARTQVLEIMQAPALDEAQGERRRKARAAEEPERLEGRPGPSGDERLRQIASGVRDRMRGSGRQAVHAALDLLSALLPGPADGERAPADRPSAPGLSEVVEQLEPGGIVDRLIEGLPERERSEGDPYGAVLLEVIRHRPVAANLARLRELLSYGFFHGLFGLGGISGGEAWLAYQIVRRLPPADQERWRRLDNGLWFRRLEDHIPEERRGAYEGVVVERDPDGRLADVASRISGALADDAGRAAWDRVLAATREGIDEARAPGLLLRINGAGERIPEARRDEVRRAVVLRLDQLGLLSRILVALPDRFLFDIDNLTLVRRIAALRDPEHIRRQVHDLIGRNFWHQIPIIGRFLSPWSVSAHEAFIAFQLVRLLPEADRRELEASGHWGAMVDAMTVEMRQASGVHLFADRHGQERDRIQERLRDDRLWTGSRSAELRTLVRLAIELGLRRFVFDRSRETRAFGKPELLPMVEAFTLYAEPRRTHYEAERLPLDEAPEDLWGVIRRVGGWLWVKLRALSALGRSLRAGEHGVGVKELDLGAVQELLGGSLGPAVLAGPQEKTGGPGPTAVGATVPAAGAGNQLTLLYDPPTGLLTFSLPRLEVASVNQLSSGIALRSNRIVLSGLSGAATFPPSRGDRPNAVRLTLSQAEITDLLVTGDDLLVGIASTVARTLGLHLSETGVDEPVPQSPGSDYALPIPVLAPLVATIIDLVQTVRSAKQEARSAFSLRGLQVTLGSVEFTGISYGSGVTAHSARIDNVLLGIGLNRPAYLRSLQEVLRRRLARAVERGADAATRGALERRIAQTQAELESLKGRESRLAELRRRYVRDPGAVTEAERREAAALEREMTGGAVLDVGRVALEGLDGDVQAKDIKLTGVTGEVSAPVFGPDTAPLSSVFVTDPERIAEFRRRAGRTPPTGTVAPAVLPLRAEESVTTGFFQRGDIPSAASLRKQLDSLPPGTPEERRKLLRALVAQVEAYEELQRQAREHALSPGDRKKLDGARDELQRLFGFRAAQVRARGVGADLLIGPALTRVERGEVVAESFTATDVAYGGFFTAKEITGGGVGAAWTDRTGDRVGGPERQNLTFHADRLKASGAVVDWAGNRADEVGVSGLAGELQVVRATPGGPAVTLRIPNLTVASATVSGLDYRNNAVWLHSTGTTRITGVALTAELHRTAGTDGPGWIVRVPHLRLDRVSADRLLLERNAPGTPFRAEITSGSLLNIDVQDYVFRLGTAQADDRLPRRFEIGGLDQLRFDVALGALGGGSGVLSSVTATGRPQLTGTLVVQAGSDAEQGGEQIDLAGLQLTQGVLSTKSGRVQIKRLTVGASVHHSGDVWTVRELKVPELRVEKLRWRTADGAEITSQGPAALTGLYAVGSLTAPPGQPVRVHVDHLGVAAVTAEHLRYQQGSLILELGRPDAPRRTGHPPLEIRDIRLLDLDWTSTRGIGKGTLDVGSAAVEFHGQVTDHLRFGATVEATTIHADFTSGGHVVLRARGTADADVAWEEPGPPGAPTPKQEAQAHVRIAGLDTGVVAIGPDGIEFGPGTEPGLQIADITVDRIHYASPGLRIDSIGGGRGVVLRRPHAKFRVELRNAAERKAAGRDTSPIRRILLRELGIDVIEIDGLKVTLPTLLPPDPAGAGRPVELWLAPGETGLLRGTSLVLPPEGAAIAAPTAPGGGWTIPELHLQVTGETGPGAAGGTSDALLLPKLRARIAGILPDATARVAVERIDVDHLSGGGVVVDLRHPSITALEAVFPGTPQHRLRLVGLGPGQPLEAGGVRADRARFDSRTNQVTITELGLKGLSYENADAGLEVTVDSARVPGEIRDDLRTGSKDPVRELIVDGASFRLDLSQQPAGPPAAKPWTELLARLGPYRQVFDSLQATIQLTIHQTATGWFRTDTRVNLSITDGRLDYSEIQQQIIGGYQALVHFDLPLGKSELDLSLSIPTPDGMQDLPVAVWHLDRDELRQADTARQIRLWRLLDPEGELRTRLEAPSKPGAAPSPVELRDIVLDLAARSARPIPIDLAEASRGKITGKVILAPDALSSLRLTGALPGGLVQDQAGLSQAKIETTEVHLPGGPEVRSGEIVITGLRDLNVTLSPSWEPRLLSGRIDRAVARGITWRRP